MRQTARVRPRGTSPHISFRNAAKLRHNSSPGKRRTVPSPVPRRCGERAAVGLNATPPSCSPRRRSAQSAVGSVRSAVIKSDLHLIRNARLPGAGTRRSLPRFQAFQRDYCTATPSTRSSAVSYSDLLGAAGAVTHPPLVRERRPWRKVLPLGRPPLSSAAPAAPTSATTWW